MYLKKTNQELQIKTNTKKNGTSLRHLNKYQRPKIHNVYFRYVDEVDTKEVRNIK